MADRHHVLEKAHRLREETASLRRWATQMQQDAQRSRALAQKCPGTGTGTAGGVPSAATAQATGAGFLSLALDL